MTRRYIINFDNTNEEYNFNGVNYTVESQFEKPDILHFYDNNHFRNRIQKYLTGDFSDLQVFEYGNKIESGYRCSTVVKEDYYAVEK